MATNYNAYVQPNVGIAPVDALFAGDIPPIDIAGAANFVDLYGELTDVHSAQSKAAAQLVLQLVEKTKVVLPTGNLWVPDYIESTKKPSEFDLDTLGITFIIPEKDVLSIKKDGIKRNNAVQAGHIALNLNTGERPATHVKQIDNTKIFAQRVLTVSGRVVKR